MKRKIKSVILGAVVLLILTGCENNAQIERTESDTASQTVTMDAVSDTESVDDINSESTSESESETEPTTVSEEEPTEEKTPAPQPVAPSTEKPAEASVQEPAQKPAEMSPSTQINDSEQAKPVQVNETPPVSVPAPTEAAQPSEQAKPAPEEPKPSAEQPSEAHTEPEFNIDYWIEFAKNYAVSIGLELDPTAVECWDNPIIADSHCKYLERDITDGLNFYKNIEGFTDIWVWAEPDGKGSYRLYIGYA